MIENNIESLIINYQLDDQVVDLVRQTKIALLAGISGAGKDTIKKRLLQDSAFRDIVSHTTRPPRINNNRSEIAGVDYHFIDLSTAEQMLRNNEFIEAKFVHGTVYGTSVAELQAIHDGGQIAVTDIDVQGVAEYKKLSPNDVAIFIVPPDFNTWMTRLKSRYATEDDFRAEWPKRRLSAAHELAHVLETPYYHVIVNDDLDRAVRVCREIIERGDVFVRQDEEARLVVGELLKTLKVEING